MRLSDTQLESSSVVANSRMNRGRGALGVNSCERELGLNVIAWLEQRLRERGQASWLDLCCGSGNALLEVASHFNANPMGARLRLRGVDLMDTFPENSPGRKMVRLEAASLHNWSPQESLDLITCVHGLHYIGDKLGLLERAAEWLNDQGKFVANLDLANFRLATGEPMGRILSKRLRECGLAYDRRKHLLTWTGRKSFSFGFRYLGADDQAGPNYSHQDVVHSYYEVASQGIVDVA